MLDRIDKLEAQMRDVMRRLPREAPAVGVKKEDALVASPVPSPFAAKAKSG